MIDLLNVFIRSTVLARCCQPPNRVLYDLSALSSQRMESMVKECKGQADLWRMTCRSETQHCTLLLPMCQKSWERCRSVKRRTNILQRMIMQKLKWDSTKFSSPPFVSASGLKCYGLIHCFPTTCNSIICPGAASSKGEEFAYSIYHFDVPSKLVNV